MSFQFESDPFESDYAYLLEGIQEGIQKTYEEENVSRGLIQADIARNLNVDPSVVSRRINGGGNVTLRSISELYTAMGREPFSNFSPPPSRNSSYPLRLSSVANSTVIIYVNGPTSVGWDGYFRGMAINPLNASGMTVCIVNQDVRLNAQLFPFGWSIDQNQTIDVKAEEVASGTY